MTTAQKRKILIRIQKAESELEGLKDVRAKLLENPYQSATISSGGGSRSYTVADSSRLTKAIEELTQELEDLRALLYGKNGLLRIGQIYTVYC